MGEKNVCVWKGDITLLYSPILLCSPCEQLTAAGLFMAQTEEVGGFFIILDHREEKKGDRGI